MAFYQPPFKSTQEKLAVVCERVFASFVMIEHGWSRVVNWKVFKFQCLFSLLTYTEMKLKVRDLISQRLIYTSGNDLWSRNLYNLHNSVGNGATTNFSYEMTLVVYQKRRTAPLRAFLFDMSSLGY